MPTSRKLSKIEDNQDNKKVLPQNKEKESQETQQNTETPVSTSLNSPKEVSPQEMTVQEQVRLELDDLQKFADFLPFLEATARYAPANSPHPLFTLIGKLNDAKVGSLEYLTYSEKAILVKTVKNAMKMIRDGNITVPRNLRKAVKERLARLECAIEEAESEVTPFSSWMG